MMGLGPAARRTALLAGALLGLVLVASACSSGSDSNAPAAEAVSDAEYAREVCSSLERLADRETDLAASHSALDASDPAAFQQDALALVHAYVDGLRREREQLTGLRPRSAPDASSLFDAYLGTAIDRLAAIAGELDQADASGAPEFQAEVSTFEANLQYLRHELPDPIETIDDERLLRAFADEPACADLVVVHGS
jgi:hypothetical protein